MIKDISFGPFFDDVWPPANDLKAYFIDPAMHQQLYQGGNDNWGLGIEGVNGTEHLVPWKTRIDIQLNMWGHTEYGVLLYYAKYGGGHKQHLFSRGDMTRIKEWVRTLHGDLRPIGLYIPFVTAWLAVKEFMETDGELPKSIEWVRAEDLPPNTFPDPWEHPEIK